ncbi:hypothetical protein DFH28DRAFT_1192138 [Melampsora americana]|nr:hypothetical protein DFH28DRAFT_1138543 [Melampsora americana]KAH9808973.1 hypothetical protein DFH28DRAFT_1192138 [Melampsora americana]
MLHVTPPQPTSIGSNTSTTTTSSSSGWTGLLKDGEMLEIDEAMGEPCEWFDGQELDSDHHHSDDQVEEVMKTAEGILIKESIEECQLQSKS